MMLERRIAESHHPFVIVEGGMTKAIVSTKRKICAWDAAMIAESDEIGTASQVIHFDCRLPNAPEALGSAPDRSSFLRSSLARALAFFNILIPLGSGVSAATLKMKCLREGVAAASPKSFCAY